MKCIKIICLLFLVLSVSKTTAQEFKLGKVSVAELQERAHPKDTSAVAAILFKKGKSRIEYIQNDGFVMVTEVETRIKIYKKEGYEWATQKVYYYNNSNLSEKVRFEDAVTYNLVNGSVEKTKLNSEGIFDENFNKVRAIKKITMPNVKEGSVIEYKYSIRTPTDRLIRDWSFQESIPVNYSEFVTYIPEYYVFNSRQKGYISPKVSTQLNRKTITIVSKERSESKNTQTSFSSDKIDYSETQTTYVAQHFPAMKEESFVNNIDNYTSSVAHELAVTNFPNQLPKSYSTNWNAVVKTIYEYDDFGPELNKTGYFEADLKEILNGKNTENEKILAILNHVKSNVKWNEYFGYACDNGVKKAYKEKSGNIADINLMMTAMLRSAGLTANPVLVSTRANGIALFPNRNAYNYVIAAVETANGNVLLDASDQFSTPNILPFRALNWQGRLIRKDGSSDEVNLMPVKPSMDNVFLSYTVDAEGKVLGKSRRQYTDYNAMITRANFNGLKEDDYLEKLENQNGKIEISEYARTNVNELMSPVVESYSFVGNNLSEVIGGKIYLSPMLFFANDKNPFNQEVRQYPVDFGFPFTDKYSIAITIPEGFTVESLPTPALISMENNVGIFKFDIAVKGNLLQLSILKQINEPIVPAEGYEMLKEYYTTLVAKESEKIVLKRI
ncbi:transglutaminase domain-containing protein [Flavobacterium sp. TMP13]|uniref:DUF3857 domain-containing protein n=1 Tax=Flavobacterium sp. TMP13 TaxID=3425950 RepID=UPI003D76C5D8